MAEDAEVKAFLASVGLSQYAADLTGGGYDSMEILRMMSREDAESCGVRPGHALKLIKLLQRDSAQANNLGADSTAGPGDQSWEQADVQQSREESDANTSRGGWQGGAWNNSSSSWDWQTNAWDNGGTSWEDASWRDSRWHDGSTADGWEQADVQQSREESDANTCQASGFDAAVREATASPTFLNKCFSSYGLKCIVQRSAVDPLRTT